MSEFIRKANQVIPLSLEQTMELARLMRRPTGIFRFLHYCSVNTESGEQNFAKVLKPYQRDMISLFQDNDRAILLASRQMSKTTIGAFYLLYEACFPKVKGDLLIVAHKQSHAQEVLRRIKGFYYSCPLWLKPGIVKNNETSVEFDNGCRIIAEATTANAARGKSLRFVYCVDGKTSIFIRNKNTGEIREIDIQDLYLSDEYR